MKDVFAFPRKTGSYEAYSGMELRDWFAGQALAGLVSDYWETSHDHLAQKDYAEIAYEIADKVMEVRNKEQNND
jgi:hypothetical protein